MAKKLDIEKVELALRRAAQTAVSGNRECQSGRFTAESASKVQRYTNPKRNTPNSTDGSRSGNKR